mmetsp:Transcript_61735/g.145954  ORF Transcript_61735/g.145954 Transcript_61735/m.145954 type:complete len:222 (-) Transcript_61735:83-748(-)
MDRPYCRMHRQRHARRSGQFPRGRGKRGHHQTHEIGLPAPDAATTVFEAGHKPTRHVRLSVDSRCVRQLYCVSPTSCTHRQVPETNRYRSQTHRYVLALSLCLSLSSLSPPSISFVLSLLFSLFSLLSLLSPFFSPVSSLSSSLSLLSSHLSEEFDFCLPVSSSRTIIKLPRHGQRRVQCRVLPPCPHRPGLHLVQRGEHLLHRLRNTDNATATDGSNHNS